MPDIPCRLARLEERVENNEEQMAMRREHDQRVQEMLEDIKRTLNQMRGFACGVGFVFSIIGSAAAVAWDKVVGH